MSTTLVVVPGPWRTPHSQPGPYPPIPRANPGAGLWLLTLSGRDDTPPTGPQDAGQEDAGAPDAGPYVWDGTYEELEDPGDWVDTGRYDDTCQFLAAEDPSPSACESLAGFDLSSCDANALAAMDPQGIYQASLRTERRIRDGGTATSTISQTTLGFWLHADGTPDTLSSGPVVTRQTDGGTYFVVGKRTHPILGTTVVALAGCHVPAPGRITGCFVRCSSDSRFGRTLGTFEAHRMAWSGREAESSGGLELLSEAATPVGRPVDLFIAKEHAYVVSIERGVLLGGLSVFDVSDPRSPVLKTTLRLPEDTSWNGVWAKGDALYIASNSSGVVLYDISQPAAPAFVRVLTAGPYGVHTVLVDGDRLYAMSPGSGTYVYDVSRPLTPELLTIISLPEAYTFGGPHDAFAYEGRLYISNDFGGYSIMDVTHLEDVRLLGHYFRPDTGYAHHSAVGTFGGRTIAFEGGEFAGSHVRVLDVTDPAHLVKIGEFRMRPVASMHNLLLRGNLLYVA